MTLARFLIHSSWLWRAFIGLDISNGQFSTGLLFHYFDRFLAEYENRFDKV